MDINATSLTNSEMTLNKTNVGIDILSKTMEKTTETKELPQNRQVEEIPASKTGEGNLIDTYA
jgi:hypothetical protein